MIEKFTGLAGSKRPRRPVEREWLHGRIVITECLVAAQQYDAARRFWEETHTYSGLSAYWLACLEYSRAREVAQKFSLQPYNECFVSRQIREKQLAGALVTGDLHHAAVVEQGQVEAAHVQADELWVKLVGRKVWLALALAVGSQLWLGGEISAQRDGEWIPGALWAVAQRVRRCLADLGILWCVDGFSSYVTQFRQVFRVSRKLSGRGAKADPS